MVDEDKRVSKIRRFLKDCPFVDDSLAMQNFFANQKFNAQYSSDFFNMEFTIDDYTEKMEFLALTEFNKYKGKDFIKYEAFDKCYQEADQ